jgi:hypothetical protein
MEPRARHKIISSAFLSGDRRVEYLDDFPPKFTLSRCRLMVVSLFPDAARRAALLAKTIPVPQTAFL